MEKFYNFTGISLRTLRGRKSLPQPRLSTSESSTPQWQWKALIEGLATMELSRCAANRDVIGMRREYLENKKYPRRGTPKERQRCI